MSCILTGSGFRNEVMNFCVNMTKCPLRLHMRVALDVSPVSIWGEATDLRKLGAWGSKCHHSKNWDDTKEPYGDDLEIGNIELVWKNVSQLFKKGSLFISVLVVAIPIHCQDNHSGRVSNSGGKIMSIRVSMMRKPVSWHFSSLQMECEKLVLASGTVGCCAAAARHRFCAETAVSSKEAVKTQASSKMSLHILFSQVWRITLTVCMFVFSSAYINGYFCVCVCVSVSVQGGGKRDNAHRNSRISVLY